MKMNAKPGMIISGTGSGSGKTSISAGIAANLANKGIRVQTFKVGPDYLDPTWLTAASGRPCINLDSWMTDRDHIQNIYTEFMEDADFALIEGVMGLYDGAGTDSFAGSTADIAVLLDLPVYIIINVKGMAKTVSAVAGGLFGFNPAIRPGGVIANYCSSERHAEIIADSLSVSELPGLTGWFASGDLPEMPGRHLGLFSAGDLTDSSKIIDLLSDAIGTKIDFESIYKNITDAACTPDFGKISAGNRSAFERNKNILQEYLNRCKTPYREENIRSGDADDADKASGFYGVRIGVAFDEAFYFYYPDNLTLLKSSGAEIVFFSPVHDENLPENLDAIYLGGGYPEIHAEKLSLNESMRKNIYSFSETGGFIYAECGGLMYLSRSIENLEGKTFPMTGVFSFSTRMLEKRKALGYVEAKVLNEGLFGAADVSIRGHEFHYSEIMDADSAVKDEYGSLYHIKKRKSQIERDEGYCINNVYASYVHIHLASSPGIDKKMIDVIKNSQRKNNIYADSVLKMNRTLSA